LSAPPYCGDEDDGEDYADAPGPVREKIEPSDPRFERVQAPPVLFGVQGRSECTSIHGDILADRLGGNRVDPLDRRLPRGLVFLMPAFSVLT
jgi:hypothetical protein